MIILAFSLPKFTGNPFLDFLGSLGSLILFALLVSKAKKEFWPSANDEEVKPIKVSPNPLPVELVKSLATLDDLDKLRSELKSDISNLRRDMKSDDDGLHRRVGAISVKLATVDGKMDSVVKSLNLLIEKAVK